MKIFRIITALTLAAAVVPAMRRRFTHGVAANAKQGQASSSSTGSGSEGTKEPLPELPELKAALERAEKAEARVLELEEENKKLSDDLVEANEEIEDLERLLRESPDETSVGTPVKVDDWAASELAKFKRAVAIGNLPADLDPELREKIRAGLSPEQAIEVISAQRRHDAAQAEKQTANPA